MRFSALVRAFHDGEGDRTLRLLVAAMLAPVIAPPFGWAVPTPFSVPLGVHVFVLALLGAWAVWQTRAMHTPLVSRRSVRWIAVLPLGVVCALILQRRSNAFYTATALMEGMAILLGIHLAQRAMRRHAHRRRELRLLETAQPGRSGLFAGGRRGWIGARRVSFLPAVAIADALSGFAGWTMVASWLLIALVHRHIAGPLLLLAGALEGIAMVVLVPDALAGSGWLGREPEAAPADGQQSPPPRIAVHDQPARMIPASPRFGGIHVDSTRTHDHDADQSAECNLYDGAE